MFLTNSRYYGLETVEATNRSGRRVTAVKLRQLPATTGEKVTVVEGDRLDILAEHAYADPTLFWHVADANTELEANALTQSPGRSIEVPES